MYVHDLKNKLLKIVFGWCLVLASLLGIFFVVNLIPSKKSVEENAEFETKFLRLLENKNYSSSFMASNNYLNRIDVLFKNPNLESRDELDIYIKGNNNIIYKQSFSGFNFGDTSHARLDFMPVADSADKKFSVEIVATKIVDGKLAFGVKNSEINFVAYYSNRLDVKNSIWNSVKLIQNTVFLWPLLLVVFLLW